MAEEKEVKYQITPTIRIFPEFDGPRVNCRKYCESLGIAVTVEAPSPRNEEEVVKYTKAVDMATFMKKAVLANAHAEIGWDAVKKEKTSEADLLKGIGVKDWDDPKLVKWFEDGFTTKPAPRGEASAKRAEEKAKASQFDMIKSQLPEGMSIEDLIKAAKKNKK